VPLFRETTDLFADSIISLPTILLASQSKDDSDPLKPYTTCEMGGDLKVKDITRRPKSAGKYREVTTDRGNERVSVVNGYRVMFGYEDVRYYFVKLRGREPLKRSVRR